MRRHAKAALAKTHRVPSKAKYLVVLTAALAFLLVPSFAQAGTTTTRPLLFSFDGSGTPQGSFSAFDMAVDDSSGRIYVADALVSHVVNAFDSSGNFLYQLDGSNTPLGSLMYPYAVAVDNSGGSADENVYILDYHPGVESQDTVVNAFDSSGNFLYQLDGSETPYFGGPQAPFGGAIALAVDTSGNLLIATGVGHSEARVYKYATTASSASYVSAVSVNPLTSGMAVDSVGNLYINDRDHPDVTKLDSAGNPLTTILSTGISPALAVDPASADTLYVGDDTEVLEYSSSGSLIRRFAAPFGGQGGVATDPSGKVYAAAGGNVNVYGPPTSVTVSDLAIDTPSLVGFFTATLSGSINPQGVPSSYFFEYKQSSASHWSSTPVQSAGEGTSTLLVDAELTGLKHSTKYEVRLVASADSGAVVNSPAKPFTTAAVTPPMIDPPSAITADSASLSGTVNPRGAPTDYHFEYSVDGTQWTSTPSQSAGSGTSDVEVTANLADLLPNQKYFVRLLADHGSGGQATSAQETFTTDSVPPVVTARSAFPVVDTSATLRGVIDAEHASTTYYFEYGPDESYGSTAPLSQAASAGSALDSVPVQVAVAGLAPETTYHYRLIAENEAGVTEGEDVSFTTLSSQAAEWPARGIELVNQPDKANQAAEILMPGSGSEFEGNGAEFGDGTVPWSVKTSGAPGSSTGLFSYFLAQRTVAGWRSHSLLPPADQLIGGGSFQYPLRALSKDASRAIFEVRVLSGLVPVRLVRWDVTSRSQTVLVEAHEAQDGKNVHALNGITASDDTRHVFMHTESRLVPAQVSGTRGLYDVGNATPELINRMPNGSVPLCGLTAKGFGQAGHPYSWISTDPSHDGTRVFFESKGSSCGGSTNLYRRDLETQSTVQVSSPSVGGTPGDSHFLRASPDGDTVIYASYTRLDNDDANSHRDVYRWNAGSGNDCLTCVVEDAEVLHSVGNDRGVAVSADLSYVYFSSDRQLVPGEGEGQTGLINLYVLHDGEIRYISRYKNLAGNNAHTFATGQNVTKLALGGRQLFFLTTAQLTPEPGPAHWYRYDDSDGSLECVDCAPPGIPEALSGSGGFDVAESGIAVFNTKAPLSPEDVNGRTDIYEWRDGRTRLITDGVTEWPRGLGEPTLAVVSPSGTNVFFTTQVGLTGHEQDIASQLYTARVGGGFAPPLSPPAPCIEDACQGPLAPSPRLDNPGSATFAGSSKAVKVKKKKSSHEKRKKRKRRQHRRQGDQR